VVPLEGPPGAVGLEEVGAVRSPWVVVGEFQGRMFASVQRKMVVRFSVKVVVLFSYGGVCWASERCLHNFRRESAFGSKSKHLGQILVVVSNCEWWGLQEFVKL